MHYYATHLLRHGITANAIAPAFIESDMTAHLAAGDAMPLGRKGRPDEVANVLKLLVTTEYINGQTIHVNAGRFQT
jgi:3-oxoacyl-[acyl-carrier protein] reductase